MTPCELLAKIGFDALNTSPANHSSFSDYDDDREHSALAVIADHRAIANRMRDSELSDNANYQGAKWLGHLIDWPDRVPALKTWAGQMSLKKIIAKFVKSLGKEPIDDLFAFRAGLKGGSGMDASVCPNAIDAGFSLADHPEILIEMRPGVELLAVIGLQHVRLMSFARQEVGILFDNKIYRWAIEKRDGGYLRRWSDNLKVEALGYPVRIPGDMTYDGSRIWSAQR